MGNSKITIYEYIANKVPNDAYTLLSKYGNYTKPKNEEELVSQLKQFVRENNSMGLMALANIHPDKELIIQANEEDNKEKEKYSNANGTTTTSAIPKNTEETINLSRMMIYGSFLLIGLALVMKNK